MSKFKRLLTGLLSGAMAFSLVAAVNTAHVIAEGEGNEIDDGVENLPEVKKDGLAVKKEVSIKDDGTYDIRLESYSEGNVQVITETVPADIVLVLDVSGSMNDAFKSSSSEQYTYTPRRDAYTFYDIYYGETRYYLYNGVYYPVTAHYEDHTFLSFGTYYIWLEFEIDGVPYYLAENGEPSTTFKFRSVGTALGSGLYSSYIYNDVLYTRSTTTTTGTKLDALKTAVNAFIDEVAKKNIGVEEEKQSRVAIVKYAGNRKDNINNNNYDNYSVNPTPGNNSSNWMYSDSGNRYNNSQVVRDLTYVTDATSGQLKTTVSQFTAAGATAADYGMGYANGIFNKHPVPSGSNRQQVVIMFTDGEPNHQNGFDGTVANTAIGTAHTMKNKGVISYSIAIYDGADPANTTTNINRYLHGISSNYPNASAYNNLGTRNPDGNMYYYVASNADQLTNIFKSISSTVGGSGSSLSSTAVLKDIISSSFALPSGFDVTKPNSLTLLAVKWNTSTHDWGDDSYTDPSITLTPSVTEVDGKECLNVTGFDYKTLFRTPITEANMNQDAQINGNARKLVVIIHGVQAKNDSITGSSMQTNDPNSGIYAAMDDDEPVIQFPSPTVTFLTKSFVLDYMKAIELDYSSVLSTVDRIDDPSNDPNNPSYNRLIGEVISGQDAFDFAKKYVVKNGNINYEEITGPDHDHTFKFVYQPNTMAWDGYDSIYIKGLSADTTKKLNAWAKLSVIPANNIYYEDDFVTNTANGIVGIQYTGTWNVVGTAANNAETENGLVHGWTASLADDAEFSDGTAHTATASSTNKAQADFTFTGTGVDIYSKTDTTTGTIKVKVSSTATKEVNGKVKPVYQKSWIINTKALSNGETGYYQIPTFSVGNLEYGEYKVTLTVTTADKERCTYYLDGIRVYNPILINYNDDSLVEAYKDELRATFQTAKELIDENKAECFADEDADGNSGKINYADTEAAKYAPENEIYLAKGYEVQINPERGGNLYIGLKAPAGETTVEFTEGSKITEDGKVINLKSTADITHSTDLYYRIAPNDDGIIVIKNTGDNLLSITKLRSAISMDSRIEDPASYDETKALKAFNEFRNYRLVDYDADVLNPDEESEDVDEEYVAEEPEIQEIQVEITNPEPEASKEEKTSKDDYSWWKNLFGGFKGFYRP